MSYAAKILLLAAAHLATGGCRQERVREAPARPTITLTANARVAAAQFTTVWELRLGGESNGDQLVFGEIRSFDVDGAGNMYVLDGHDQEIRVFNLHGDHVRTISRRGPGPGELQNAWGVAVWRHQLWVSDWGSRPHYSVFDTTGSFLRAFRREVDGIILPWRGAFDADGTIFDVDYRIPGPRSGADQGIFVRQLFRVSQDGRGQTLLAFPDTVPVIGDQIQMPYVARTLIAVDPSGAAWVARSGAYRIARMTPAGDTTLILEADVQGPRLTPGERDSLFRVYRRFARGRFTISDLPERKTVMRRLLPDDRGRLFVWLHGQPGDPPRFDVWDTSGTFVGTVQSQTELWSGGVIHIRGDLLYGVERDSLDVPYLVRARLVPSDAPTN